MFTLLWLYSTKLFFVVDEALYALSDFTCPVHFGFPSQIITLVEILLNHNILCH